jgi:signal transduction histidine kinase
VRPSGAEGRKFGAQHAASAKRWRKQKIALTLGVGLQAVLIAILWAERRRRVRGQRELHRLSGQLLTAQEDERGRIARDLHDHLCQQLALLAIELDVLEAQRSEPADPSAAALGDKARAIAADVHALARELHPARLEHLGLVGALRSLALEVERMYQLRVNVVTVNWPAKLPRGLVYCLYRVAQEALQNVLKHSHAEAAHLTLHGTPQKLRLTISDDGWGFDVETGSPQHGLGLASMRERLRAVGGTLAISAAPGRGTRLEAQVPRPGS